MSLTEWSSQKQSSTYNPDKYSQKQLSKHDNGFMNEPFIIDKRMYLSNHK